MSRVVLKLFNGHCRYVAQKPFAKLIRNIAMFSYQRYEVKDSMVSIKVQNQDLLLQTLKAAPDVNTVLETVGAHHKIMNNQQMMQALRSLFSLQKVGHTKLTTPQILSHPSFNQLCKTLKFHSREIEVNDIIEALKVLTFVGVPAKSSITQILLQLIRQRINFLTLQHIIFLDFLLRRFDTTALVDALKIALPLVFELNLKKKMDRDNLNQMTDYLQFVSKNDTSDDCVESVLKVLLKFGTNMTYKEAKTILWSLCDLPSKFVCVELFNNVCDVLVAEIDNLKLVEIETSLTKIGRRFKRFEINYYHEDFFNCCAGYIVGRDLGVETAIWTLRRFVQMHHINIPILQYITTKCDDNPELLINARVIAASTLTSGIVAAQFQTIVPVEKIVSSIEHNNIIESSNLEMAGIIFATEMAMLGSYQKSLLEKVFDTQYINHILIKGNNWKRFHFLLLVQAVKYLRKLDEDILPPQHIIDSVANKTRTEHMDLPLEGALTSALGGSEYILSNIDVQFGYPIDHIIFMRKGGYPVAINHNPENRRLSLEDLQKLANDNQIVAIMSHKSSYYLSNVDRLQTPFILMKNILEATGIQVIQISVKNWKNLLDHEKIPYIMRELKNVTTENDLEI